MVHLQQGRDEVFHPVLPPFRMTNMLMCAAILAILTSSFPTTESLDIPGEIGQQSPSLPSEHACHPDGPAAHMMFCNTSLPIASRVAHLIANLSLAEKAGLMGAGNTSCAFMDAGVPRLGIPIYTWCVETNSGAGGICLEPGRCQSTFPAPVGLAASFNRSVWRSKGEIISTELRVLNNIGGMRMAGPDDYIGLNGWGPNINIIRDPRYGRNSELPTEDPVLSGEYASEMVKYTSL